MYAPYNAPPIAPNITNTNNTDKSVKILFLLFTFVLICGIIKLSENYTERDRCVSEDDNDRLFDIICSSFEKEKVISDDR